MNDLTLTITDLKTKVEKLVNLHQQLKKENEELIKTIEEQKNTIKALENKNQEITDNKNEEQNKIVIDTKLKINELVQEIDSCIALLK